jgi:hypothetical protein
MFFLVYHICIIESVHEPVSGVLPSFEELPPAVGSLALTDIGYFPFLRMRWMTETGR